MDQIATEINKLSLKIDAIEQLLETDYEKWTPNEKQKFGNHKQLRKKEEQLRKKEEQLRKKEEQLRELLILKERERQGFASQIAAGTLAVSPKQVLKDLLGFDIDTSQVNFSRPSVIVNDGIPTDEIMYIVPLMKFVCREEPTQTLYNELDSYLDWKSKKVGEAEKNIKFITVAGTSGKGKTTFARRFMDLKYTGKHFAIINDCREKNRRYRVSCTNFDANKDAETQLSLLILYEAFKHSSGASSLQDYISAFYRPVSRKLSLSDVLHLITETFCSRSGPLIQHRLFIINLDETNSLLKSEVRKQLFQELLRLLRAASDNFCLLTILSGTHSVELFEQVKISESKFVEIDLSLIELDAAKEVILGMTSTPSDNHISPFLEYILTLCGGVGRYLELAIIQMSIMGCAAMLGNRTIKGFRLDAYEYFLAHLQTSQDIESLLDKLTYAVLVCYPNVYLNYSESIELLSCYTLFQWPVQRKTIVKSFSVGHLEKEGLVFLQPQLDEPGCFICIIPFITLYWAIKSSHQNVQIPVLNDIRSYSSSDESENTSLHIIMAKLWGLTQKNGFTLDNSGLCTIMLSDLVSLRDEQPDIEIKFRPTFAIKNASHRIHLENYLGFKNSENIAFLNAKGAPFTDAVIFSEPMIGIQEKQSVVAKKCIVAGRRLASVSNKSFVEERNKFPDSGIFLMVSEEKIGDIVLGDKDIFLDYEHFTKFAGPLIALRKLFSINELNPKGKKPKLK